MIDSFTAEFLKKKSSYQNEFSELHGRMVKIFNELIGKVNQNAAILPKELINYAKHSVLKGRHELSEAIASVTKSN